MLYLKADTITEVTIGPAVAVANGYVPVTNLVGLNADEFELIKHGATTTTTIAGTLDAITGADGYYALNLSATDTNTEGRLVILINDDDLILPIRHEFMVVNANVYDSLFAAATTDYLQTDAIQWNGTAVATPDTAGHPKVTIKDGTGTGEIALTSGAVDAVTTVTTLTSLPAITSNWLTAAGLATDAVTEIQSGLATPTNITAGTITTVATTTDLTNMPTIPANWITAAGIAVGAIEADAFAANAITDAAVASDVTIASVTGSVGSVTNDLAKYSGPHGPGVYLNDGAGNTNEVSYVDGIITNPVSTIGAAQTIADALSLDRIYLINDSAITLTATMADYEFVGIGLADGNTIALASQNVDNSSFHNVTITGVQGGTERAEYRHCIFGVATIHALAYRCGFKDSVSGTILSNDDDVILDQCYSMVAGNATPLVVCSGASLDACFRHYSGGVELKALNATAQISIETDGQVVFNADCSVNAAVTIRGMCSITDNTAGMNNLTTSAAFGPTVGAPAGASVSADIAAVKAETVLIVEDTGELQTDWVDGGRLDVILDARASQTSIDNLNDLDAAAITAACDTSCDTVTVTSMSTTTVDVGKWLGTAVATPTTAGVPEVDVTHLVGIAASATQLERSASTIVTGTVNSGTTTPTTTVFAASNINEATADHYIGRTIVFTDGGVGDLEGQACTIVDYELASGEGKFTVTTLTEPPSNNDTFVII